MIELKNLYKTFFSELGTEKQVFKGLNFTINEQLLGVTVQENLLF